MANLDTLFLRISVVYIMAGLLMGIGMAASGDHGLMPAHAHINLVGWVAMTIYGLVYRVYPDAARSPLARWHFWLANAGALLLVVGVTGILAVSPERFEIFATVGAILFALGMLLFAIIVYTRGAPSTAASRQPAE